MVKKGMNKKSYPIWIALLIFLKTRLVTAYATVNGNLREVKGLLNTRYIV